MKIFNQSRLSLIAILALLIALTSCKKLNNLVNVNVPLQMANISFNILPASQGDTISSVIEYNIDSAIKATNSSLGIGNIKTATIDSIKINLTNATPNNSFTNFSGLSANISTNTNQYLSSSQLTSGSTTIDPSDIFLKPVGGVNLVPYLSATSFYYYFTCQFGTPITDTLQANATIYYNLVLTPN